MAFKKGHSKAGGRSKGTPNKKVQPLLDRAEALGVDPFEILLHFAKGDWAALGYAAASTVSYTSAGIEFDEPVIKPELRMHAAKEACQYLYPKRKSIEMTAVDGADSGFMIYRASFKAPEPASGKSS